MSLPDLIQIEPPRAPVTAVVTVPGSKSITNRALVLAALAKGTTTLRGALWSEDTRVMVDGLGRLGFQVQVEADPRESANRTIRVEGRGGEIPASGTPGSPLELQVENAGTAARFLTALVCLGRGVYRLSGVPRMHERPQAELFRALRALGYRIDAASDRLPAIVHGGGPRAGRCEVSVRESSQFASALILAAGRGGWEVEVSGANPDELPYVEMTRQLLAGFPEAGGELTVEPDASSGSYFWAAGALLAEGGMGRMPVVVEHWPTSGWQADEAFPRFLPLPGKISRARDLADSILTAMVLAPFSNHPVVFTDLARLRVQECERVLAMRTELTRCGVEVREEGETLTVIPGGTLRAAEIETYRDHRMAMCFAILGLRVPGLRLRDPGCVRKTFPNFFAKLAAPPPAGLGAGILDGRTGARLEGDQWLAD